MFATIISRALFYYAFHAGAADPEDVAQDVIVNLLRCPHWVRSNTTSYLRVAVRNQMCREWRKWPGRAPLPLEVDWLLTPELRDDGALDAVDRLMAEYPDLVAFLIDYSEMRGHTTRPGRVRACRARKRLREVLAT